jgi:hypothetical protein
LVLLRSAAYGADEVAGTSADMAGASLEAAETAEDSADEASETAELIADSADETADDTADEGAGASEEGAGAALELTTAELDGSTGVTGVGVPRLKIQMRPMITITATMMIIQVLRFICLPCVGGDETGKFVFLP